MYCAVLKFLQLGSFGCKWVQVGEPALSILFYIVYYNFEILSVTGFNDYKDFETEPQFFQPKDYNHKKGTNLADLGLTCVTLDWL